MLKHKIFIVAGVVLIGLSSCGIFKKGCNCPHVAYKAPVVKKVNS